jgi:hypothetical protein
MRSAGKRVRTVQAIGPDLTEGIKKKKKKKKKGARGHFISGSDSTKLGAVLWTTSTKIFTWWVV